MEQTNTKTRELNVKEKFSLVKLLATWEMILFGLLIGILLVGLIIRPDLFTVANTYAAIIQSGMDKAILALGMYTLLGQGDRDMSCGGLVILVAAVIGILYGKGVNIAVCLLIALTIAVVAELFSSYLVAFLNFDAIIVGIAMGTFYRGLVKIMLNDKDLNTFPEWFITLSWKNVLGGWLPVSLICFAILCVFFYWLIHRTRFGRQSELIGTNKEASNYSGLNVRKLRVGGYMVFAVMVAIASIFFVGRLGNGLNSSASTGYEFQVMVIAVLGTVEINNRRPTVLGIIIASLFYSCLNYVLGLIGIQSMEKKLIIGIILILSVAISKFDKAKFKAAAAKLKKVSLKKA